MASRPWSLETESWKLASRTSNRLLCCSCAGRTTSGTRWSWEVSAGSRQSASVGSLAFPDQFWQTVVL
eukprot:110192-Lingulodinium_polyedra.AAC.1